MDCRCLVICYLIAIPRNRNDLFEQVFGVYEISQKESGPSISGSEAGEYEDVFRIERNALFVCYIISISVSKKIRQTFS